MNPNETVEIKFDVIRSAILRIASEKPEWFYTERWLKDILFSTPSNLKANEHVDADIEHCKKRCADDPFWDLSRG